MTQGPRILIAEARFYEDIAEELFEGAKAVIDAAGCIFERVPVPGVFEIPTAIAIALEGQHRPAGGMAFDGFVALGCVIRGETSHYDIVAGESARGLMDLSIRHELAFGNGILTVDTKEQAQVRAARDGKDKGGDAVRACFAMMDVKVRFGLARPTQRK